MTHLKGLASVRRLSLFNTQVGDAGLESVATLPNLHELRLGPQNPVTDAGMDHVAKLTTLRTLFMPCRRVTDEGLYKLAPLTNLEEIDVETGFGERAVGDKRLASMKGMTRLKQLRIGVFSRAADKASITDPLTDAGMAHLKNLQGLRELKVDAVLQNVTGAGLANLAGLTNLEDLSFYFCQGLQGDSVAPLQNLARLKKLRFTRCDNLDDAGVEYLKGLTNLEDVFIDHCSKVTAKGEATLRKALPRAKIKISLRPEGLPREPVSLADCRDALLDPAWGRFNNGPVACEPVLREESTWPRHRKPAWLS
jgi:hypothetical protein